MTVALPLILLLWESLTLIPGDYRLSNLTSYFWVGQGNVNLAYGEPGVIHNKGILGALFNSIKLGFAVALFNAALGLMVGYAVVRGRGKRLSKWLGAIAFSPYFFPSIALAAILQIHQSLEEAARVQGIGWFRRMFRIIIPLSMSGLVAGMF